MRGRKGTEKNHFQEIEWDKDFGKWNPAAYYALLFWAWMPGIFAKECESIL
jgi:hypothetical protein